MSVPVPSTPTTPADPVSLLRAAARAARDHGDTDGAALFETASSDHRDGICPRGDGECQAVARARRALVEYGLLPAPAVPATQDDLREQVAEGIAASYRGKGSPKLGKPETWMGEATAAAKVIAPVLTWLRAELGTALIQRDKFGQLHLNEAKTHDETIRSLHEAQAEIERLKEVVSLYRNRFMRAEKALEEQDVSDQTPATPDVGRCGEPAPRLSKYEGPRVWCALPACHAGWHKADDSREWSRTDAAPSSVQGDTTEEA